MRKRLNYLKDKKNTNFLLTLIKGSILSQIIVIAISPLLTRIYSPEEFGIYTLIITIVSMFGSVITGRFEMEIVNTKKEEEVIKILIISMFLAFTLSAIVTYVSILFLQKQDFNPSYNVAIYIYLLLFFTGIINILTSYNTRNQNFSLISSVGVKRSIAQSISQLMFGIIGFGSKGLIVANLLSSIVGIRLQMVGLKKIFIYKKNLNFKSLFLTFKQNSPLLVYSSPALLLNTASYSLIIFIIGDLYTANILGYYSLTYRVLGLPLTVISMNASKVFFSRASKEYHNTLSCINSFKDTTRLLLYISVPLSLILFFIVPPLFSLIFGKEWSEAGVYLQILLPMFLIRFIVLSLTSVLIVTKNQKREFYIQFLFILNVFISYFLAKYYFFNVYEFLKIISFLFSLTYLYYFFVLYKFSSKV